MARSFPLGTDWTLLSRQGLKGIPLGQSQNQPLYRFVSASHPRNNSILSIQWQAKQFSSWQCSLSEEQVNASPEKLSEIRQELKLQGTEEDILRNPLLFKLFPPFWQGELFTELLCRLAMENDKMKKASSHPKLLCVILLSFHTAERQ